MRIVSKQLLSATVVGANTGDAFSVEGLQQANVHGVWDVNTPAAATFTAAASDICTATAHGFTTGLKGQASSTTTLPAGLSGATDYFVIALSANTFSLASSYNNALAGTAINITDAGTGTHTFTPTAIAGGSLKLQYTNDSDPTAATWLDVANAQSPAADSSYMWSLTGPYKFIRAYSTVTAGRMAVTVNLQGLSH